ncbi:MAG: CU044_2847 family protein [Cyanobacteria bacterium J06627_32]
MNTTLIRLEDGTLIEVEIPPESSRQISGGSIAKRVESSFDSIKPTLLKACRPIKDVWEELNQEMNINQVEVEIGLNFAVEGDVYIAKSKTEANLKIKLTLNPES